jgi:hypothetical protein
MPMTSFLSRLPAEMHSSAHQVRYDNSMVGEFEIRIYRGINGPVVFFEAASSSSMPMEYLSEYAVTRFLDEIPNSRARFFERHQVPGGQEVWVEVGFEAGLFFRRPTNVVEISQVIQMLPDPGESASQGVPGRMTESYAPQRRR